MQKSKKILSEAQIYFLCHIIVDFLWATFLALVCTCLIIVSLDGSNSSLIFSFGACLAAAFSGLFTGFGVKNIKGFNQSDY